MERFTQSLRECVEEASLYDIMLAIETVDNKNMDSISGVMRFVREIRSPWLQVYPDIGNLTSAGKNIKKEFRAGAKNIVAIHLKDAREGEIRRVNFGEGIVDFDQLFKILMEQDYCGPFVVEMWADNDPDAAKAVKAAKDFLTQKMALAAQRYGGPSGRLQRNRDFEA